MATILIRGISDKTKNTLATVAKSMDKTANDLMIEILDEAAAPYFELVARIQAMQAEEGDDDGNERAV